jgi:hypothetical protein
MAYIRGGQVQEKKPWLRVTVFSDLFWGFINLLWLFLCVRGRRREKRALPVGSDRATLGLPPLTLFPLFRSFPLGLLLTWPGGGSAVCFPVSLRQRFPLHGMPAAASVLDALNRPPFPHGTPPPSA